MTQPIPASTSFVRLVRDDGASDDAAPAAMIAAWVLGDEAVQGVGRFDAFGDDTVRLSCAPGDARELCDRLSTLLAEPRLAGWRLAGEPRPDPAPDPSVSGPAAPL